VNGSEKSEPFLFLREPGATIEKESLAALPSCAQGKRDDRCKWRGELGLLIHIEIARRNHVR
jgi:hypothetical protein